MFSAGKGRERGFTLLELIVIIVILGGVFMVAFPRIPMPGLISFNSDARRTATLFRFLDDAAMHRKRYYRVSFYLDDESIKIETSTDGTDFDVPPEKELYGFVFKGETELVDIVLPSFGRVDSGSVSVVFNPTFGAEPFKLHLGGGEETKTLTYNPYSGRVKVLDGYV